MKKLFSYLLLLCLCMFAYGCKQETKTISFIAEGCEKIDDISVSDLFLFKLPTDPQKEGYVFSG